MAEICEQLAPLKDGREYCCESVRLLLLLQVNKSLGMYVEIECMQGVPKQALDGIPLDFGVVMEDKPSELSCLYARSIII